MSDGLGKRLRMSRFLNPATGKGIIVAMDHGLFLGPISGIENISAAVEKVIEGQPDALQVTAGVAVAIERFLKGKNAPGFVLRVDATNIWRSRPEPKEGYHVTVASVKDAVCLGADAIVAFFFVGYESDAQEAENLERLASLASESRVWQMPLIIEPLVIEKRVHAVRDPERIKLAVRIASELGADALKVDYTGDRKSFAKIVEASTAPILVRGGPKMDSDEAVLRMVKEAMDAGAKGLVFGRNIWQHDKPAAILAALRAVVHENATVEEGLKKLRSERRRR
ncbi:MAG: aldolase [Armatimonadetes bacterium]|nr:aldolase [Armatimonadota bacterium]